MDEQLEMLDKAFLVGVNINDDPDFERSMRELAELAKACQMEVNPVDNPNSAECIRCGRCKKACPTQAIQCGIKRK